ADAKNPAIHAEPAFIKGLVEGQDEGSQLSALLARAKPGQQVGVLCAGAGGKTLALAAVMENRGLLYATDSDKRRLAPIHELLERDIVHNVQFRAPSFTTCRSERRVRAKICPPSSKTAPISCSSTRLAPVSALGAAIRTPSGGCAPGRLRCDLRSRSTHSTGRQCSSSPAVASPMS